MKISPSSKFLIVIIAFGITLLAGSMFFMRDYAGNIGGLEYTDFSPDRTHIAANSFRGFEIIDLKKGIVATLNDDGERAAFSPDLKSLAIYSWKKGKVSVWNLNANPPTKTKDLSVPADTGLIWSPDSQHLVMADNTQLASWNAADDSTKSVPLEKHEHFPYRSVIFVPEKSNALYLLNPAHFEGKKTYKNAFAPGSVEIRDPVTLALKKSIVLPVNTNDSLPELSPDGRFVKQETREAQYPHSLKLSLFNVDQRKVTKIINVSGEDSSGFTPLFSDDSELSALPRASVVNIWSTETGEKNIILLPALCRKIMVIPNGRGYPMGRAS